MLCSLSCKNIGDDGTIALAPLLQWTQITVLKCAAAPECLLSCQRPLTLLSTCFLHRARRLGGNNLGYKGGVALAKGLEGNSTLQVLE